MLTRYIKISVEHSASQLVFSRSGPVSQAAWPEQFADGVRLVEEAVPKTVTAKNCRGFESLTFRHFYCGVEKSGPSRQSHKLEFAGSNPATATNFHWPIQVHSHFKADEHGGDVAWWAGGVFTPTKAGKRLERRTDPRPWFNSKSLRRRVNTGCWLSYFYRLEQVQDSREAGCLNNTLVSGSFAVSAMFQPANLTNWSTTSGKADGTPSQHPSIDAQSLLFHGASVLVSSLSTYNPQPGARVRPRRLDRSAQDHWQTGTETTRDKEAASTLRFRPPFELKNTTR